MRAKTTVVLFIGLVLGVVMCLTAQFAAEYSSRPAGTEIDVRDVFSKIDLGTVREINLSGNKVEVIEKDGSVSFATIASDATRELILTKVTSNSITHSETPSTTGSGWGTFVVLGSLSAFGYALIPVLLGGILVFLVIFYRRLPQIKG